MPQYRHQSETEENILEIRNLKKAFEGVMAVDHVSFSVRRGEVHALMGENGAGKSTVIKIISGIHKADSGEVIYDGKKCSFSNALGAQHAGISTVYQELNMIPALSVSENIFLGRYPFDAWGIDWKAMHAAAQSLVSDLDVGIDVRKPLAEFGTAKKQIIYILRAISLKSKLIVMDEPTSSLDTNEVEMLFGIIEKLKSAGIAVIFITHRLDEVYRRCDRVTILKDGRSEGTYPISELSQYVLLEKMVGRNSLALEYKRTRRNAKGDDRVLEVKNISRVPYVRNVSFELHRGEVLGLAGLLGSGRTEIARIIFGCDIPDSGEIRVKGKRLHLRSPTDAVSRGMAFCTENRREEGLFPNMSVQSNIVACALSKLTTLGFIDDRRRREVSRDYIRKLAIKTSSASQLVKKLSGGNQQKVILSRWLAMNPELIILDEPTRGIDVGGKREIEILISEFSRRGIGVLFISSELSELVRNCDRVIVLRDGRAVGELLGDDIEEKNIMWTIANNRQLNGQN
jgi:galactofuranose transport system ATP-binding protein